MDFSLDMHGYLIRVLFKEKSCTVVDDDVLSLKDICRYDM